MEDIRLESKRIVLNTKGLVVTDTFLLEHLNDLSNVKYYDEFNHPLTKENVDLYIEGIQRKIQSPFHIVFGMYKKEKDQLVLIGILQFNSIHSIVKKAEINYWMIKKYWGEGLALEACQLACDYGFKKLGLNRIYTYCIKGDSSSYVLYSQIGFNVEGLLRKDIVNKGKLEDRFLLSKIRE